MAHFIQVILHHVHVARIDQDLLPIAHRLEQFFVALLLLYDLLLRAEVLPLLPHLLLHDVLRP